MSINKKLLIGAMSAFLLSGTSAYAGGIIIQPVISIEQERPAPVYLTPSPAYIVAPGVEGYDPHHRRHDWKYWHSHHEHDHHDHHDEHHGHWEHDHR